MPAAIRTVCLEFFGQARDAVPAIVEIKDYLDARAERRGARRAARRAGTPGRALSEGGRLCDQGQAPSAAGRRWCCSATSSATTKTRWRAAASRGRAHRQRARRRGLHRRQRRRAQEVLARPRAHRRDRPAHQRLQDQRGRGHPAARAWATTPTASSASTSSCRSRTSSRCSTRWTNSSQGELPLTQRRRQRCRRRAAGRPARAGARARRRGARALALAARASRPAGDRRRAPTLCRPRRRDRTPATVFSTAAGPQRARVLEDASCAPLAAVFDGAGVRAASSSGCDAMHTARCCRAACSSRCTCMPATATCTPTFRSTPTTTRCCTTANAAVARIMALARALDGVISGEHGIGITKLEFLTDGRDRGLPRLQADGRPARPLQRAASCCAGGDLRERLHAELQPARRRVADHAAVATSAAIADSIKDCLRCGKCKPVCATHVPRANLLYSPRNKILATSLLIEAFLYEEQTRRGVSLQALGRIRRRRRPLHRLPQVRQALPGGHRFRRRLDGDAQPAAQQGKKSFNPGTAAAMFFLNATDPKTIKLARTVDDRLGLSRRSASRYRAAQALGLAQRQTAAAAGDRRAGRRSRSR